MTGYNHTLAGAIAAIALPAPIAPLAALVSHFIFDAFPHFGRHPVLKPYTSSFVSLLIVDGMLCILSLIFALALFPDKWIIILVCTFFSTLPDFLWLLEGRVRSLEGFFKFASDIQWGERPWGWTLEIFYGIIFTTILVLLSY
jgi:hypothetical protein